MLILRLITGQPTPHRGQLQGGSAGGGTTGKTREKRGGLPHLQEWQKRREQEMNERNDQGCLL